jgi:hypothetical protein
MKMESNKFVYAQVWAVLRFVEVNGKDFLIFSDCHFKKLKWWESL